MPKQFLLNVDGSIPENTNIEVLISANIPLVVPTPMPVQVGKLAIECDPECDQNGVWRQVWKLEDVLTAPQIEEQVVDPLTSLTVEQKLALISLLDSKV